MICKKCGTRNAEDVLRCRKCGRTADDTLTGEFVLRQNGALAEQLRRAPLPNVHWRNSNLAHAVQRRLFQQHSGSNVIPIETFPPVKTPVHPNAKVAPRKPGQRSRVTEEQGTLDFLPQGADKPRTLGTAVEAVIFCEDPVASRLHRTVAAALDWSMVFIGYGLFLSIFRIWSGPIELNRTNLIVLGSLLPILACTYGILWAIAGYETPGKQWTQLRLTTFDGFRPERKQLLLRFAGSCLSLCTVIGVLWSFADEENLAWQDHISRTFPTPGLKSDRFLRR